MLYEQLPYVTDEDVKSMKFSLLEKWMAPQFDLPKELWDQVEMLDYILSKNHEGIFEEQVVGLMNRVFEIRCAAQDTNSLIFEFWKGSVSEKLQLLNLPLAPMSRTEESLHNFECYVASFEDYCGILMHLHKARITSLAALNASRFLIGIKAHEESVKKIMTRLGRVGRVREEIL